MLDWAGAEVTGSEFLVSRSSSLETVIVLTCALLEGFYDSTSMRRMGEGFKALAVEDVGGFFLFLAQAKRGNCLSFSIISKF